MQIAKPEAVESSQKPQKGKMLAGSWEGEDAEKADIEAGLNSSARWKVAGSDACDRRRNAEH